MKNYMNNPNQRKKRRSKWLWLVLLFVVVAVLVSGLLAAKMRINSDASTVDGGTFVVRHDNLTVIVTEGGSIKAHKSIEYKCKVERGRETGDLTILSVVPAGTYVKQEDVKNGMILVQLDSSAFEERLVQENMELASDKENELSAIKARDIQIIQNESDIAEAKLRVRFALLDLQKYLGEELANKLVKDVNSASNLTEHIAPFLKEVEADPNMLEGSSAADQLKRLEDDITMAEGNLKNAQDTLDGTKRLHDANYVSDLELQRDELTLQNRKFAKESAVLALDLFKKYDFPKNAEQFLSDYIEAGRQLQRVDAQCSSRLAQAQVKVSTAQEQLYWQEQRVKEIKQNIEYCTIRAQAPGLVVYGTGGSDDMFRSMRYRGGGSGSGVIAEGETVSEGQTILSMPDTATMVAEISVHETEVDKVKVGQPATIIMDAFPDKILEGVVTEVGSLPDQQRGFMNPDLKVYKTLVTIDGSHDFLKSRMSCKVNILVEDLEDVIVVPIQVVSNRNGRKVCYVINSNGYEEHVVQTGLFNDTFVEVVEGLEAGEEVMLNPPLLSELGGTDSFQQRQPIPQKKAGSDVTDANDTGDRGPGRGRSGRFGDGQRMRRGRPSEGGERQLGGGQTQNEGPPTGGAPMEQQGGGAQMGEGGPRLGGRQFQPGQSPPGFQGGQFQPTDEMILAGMKHFDPKKAEELEKLKNSDPEKFKAEIQKVKQEMRQRMQQMRQGGGGMGPGMGGGMGQGQGGGGGMQGQGDGQGQGNR
ncbi:MAG: HlyD family efflux transporter periplasmic adaptor subunit [Sedimentisphaerales bacterium]|nr:HlyD family efflux transporter periplasmic adaptor subunit [Sedimentisphaerales bacterium]